MSPSKSHEALVGRQFGTRAAAYLSSAVHAQGADLESLSALVEEDSQAHVLDLGCVAEHLPFPDASFDRVLSRYSAHHWRDFEAGLREAARVLKPGGIAGFVDTVSPGAPLLDTYLQGI